MVLLWGALPYVEVLDPLGIHLQLATKEKIWRGEYVDLFSLLFKYVSSNSCSSNNKQLVSNHATPNVVKEIKDH